MTHRIISQYARISMTNHALNGKLFETASVPSCCRKNNPSIPYKCYSSVGDGDKSVTKLLKETHKALFYAKPIQTDKEPTSVHILLLDCKSPDAVLELFVNMTQSNQLSNDDGVLYLKTIVKLIKQSSLYLHQPPASPAKVLQDSRFHSLIEKIIIHSPYLDSGSLSHLFAILVYFGVPVSSHTMQHTIKTIKSRINDFFPQDVAVCTWPLKALGSVDPTLQELDHVLLLHLENLAVDECFFQLSFNNSLLRILELCSHFTRRVSPHLRTGLQSACYHMVTKYQHDKKDLTVLEKIELKRFLAYFAMKPLSKKLLSAASIDQNDIPSHKQRLIDKLDTVIGFRIQNGPGIEGYLSSNQIKDSSVHSIV